MSWTRPELSKKSPYYISKHRYYELKHFCMRWEEFEKGALYFRSCKAEGTGEWDDPVGEAASLIAEYTRCMELIRKSSEKADELLAPFIFLSATKGLSYDILRARTSVPCCRDYFYERMRRFFYILSLEKGY